MYTHVHPSKGNYYKDPEKKSITFDIDLFYNPLHVRLRILYIIIILILLDVYIRSLGGDLVIEVIYLSRYTIKGSLVVFTKHIKIGLSLIK